VSGVWLRPVEGADLDALSDQMRDPESVWMAAFTFRGPGRPGCLRCAHGQAQEIA
jgi:hypothetical protein